MSPWTRKQIGYLLSKDSPLTADEQQKMRDELATYGKKAIRKPVKPEKPRPEEVLYP